MADISRFRGAATKAAARPDWQALYARGFSVFPIPKGSKKPAIPWKAYQTERATREIVERWQRHDSNVGIATGQVSGLVVLDLDSAEAVAEAERRGLPQTLRVKTGKGLHVYFRHPGGEIGNRAGIFPGADIRGDGGYVIAPGSTHPTGAAYQWQDDGGEIAPMPDWLASLLTGTRAKQAPAAAPAPARAPKGGEVEPYAQAALEAELAALRGAGEGGRNDQLNRSAFALAQLVAGGALAEDLVKRQLQGTAYAIGLDGAEIDATIESAFKAGMATPRTPPERTTRSSARKVEHDPETGEILDGRSSDSPLASALEQGQSEIEPVDLWGAFAPPDLPHNLLPPIIEQWARVNADHMGCDPAGLAMAALATCAAAIPDRVSVRVKQHGDWQECARIWVALVGEPSTKKSPILSAATRPLCKLDADLFRGWQKQLAQFDALPKDERANQKRPAMTRLRIEDATVEAAQQVLEGSPWGIMLLQDELSGFFGAMDKYSGAKAAQADRAFWLRSFNGGEYALSRVGRGNAIIPNLSVSMLGGIQPAPLRKIASDTVDDGMLQRLFTIMLKRGAMGRDEPMPPVNAGYDRLIESLHNLRLAGLANTGVLIFSDDAARVQRQFHERFFELQNMEFINRKLGSHIGKYEGLLPRLSLIWHCIEHAARADDEPLPMIIGASAVERAGQFLERYLLAHAVSFYAGCLGLSDDHDQLTAIAGYILAHKCETVTNRDIARGNRTMRGLKDFEVQPLLQQLEALGWLERVPGPRPSSPPHYVVNPLVHARFAERAESEAAIRQEVRRKIAQIVRG